jgi:Xaa-Pro aminopeptidase
MCHYAAPEEGGRPVRPDSILLLDIGSQYRDGTTDTTRTVTFLPPPPEVRRAYTAVLQGHIALALLTFPDGAFGHQLDPFARAPLWRLGLDYDHGTGHGVGHFLSVHEFPQRLAKQASDAPLRAGMTLTNEPGYYKPDSFGIRIENLCEVAPAPVRGFLRLEPLTLVPISRRLLEIGALSDDEIAWVDAYHQRVRKEIRPLLAEAADRAWLQFATAPLAHSLPYEA